MAYRNTREAFDELAEIIKGLFESKETMILYTENPRRLCYRLREAFHACQFHEDLVKYASCRDLFAFEEHVGYVRARYRGSDAITKIEVTPGNRQASRSLSEPKNYPKKEPEEPIEKLEPMEVDELDKVLSTANLPEVATLMGILDAVKRYGSRVMEVYFPDARLSETDLARLYNWTSERGWGIINMEDAGITITKRAIQEDLEWTPQEQE